jgi:hypothetical protein
MQLGIDMVPELGFGSDVGREVCRVGVRHVNVFMFRTAEVGSDS